MHTVGHTLEQLMSDVYDILTLSLYSIYSFTRGSTVYPLFERLRPRNVCGRFGRATASTEKNRDDSFELRMQTTTLHAQFEAIIMVRLRQSCGYAKPYRQEKLQARALHNGNERSGPMLPPGCCSRFVWPTRSTSLLARAPIVVCSNVVASKSIA